MSSTSLLAEYLRARRQQVDPRAVGLGGDDTGRRVTGLRREEVAMLAGISADYYLRLEQGRLLNPSTRVLEGLVRALQLSEAAAEHLYTLAWPESRESAERDDAISENVRILAESMSAYPIHISNRCLDLLYVNDLTTALAPAFVVGANLVRMTFESTTMSPDYWRSSTRYCVAHLRASADLTKDSPELDALVSEMSEKSDRFVELWERHEVMSASGFPMAFYRSDIGHLELRYQSFTIPKTGGQMLNILSAAPGGPSARALERLSLMIAHSPSSIRSPRAEASQWSTPQNL